jgi:hypothetical protein
MSRIDEPRPEPTSRPTEGSPVPDRLEATTSAPAPLVDTPAPERANDVDTSVLAAVRSFVAEPSVESSGDEGVAWRRLSGTDLATGTGAVPAAAAPPVPEPLVPATPARSSDEAPARDAMPPPGREPEMESVTLSIGSIEVIVDGGSAGMVPAPVIAAPAVATARAIDDPIMRLRRQYVTWPDGD